MVKNWPPSFVFVSKNVIVWLFSNLLITPLLWAQPSNVQKSIQSGYKLTIQYNLYNRFSQVSSASQARVSSGQVLNALPDVGFGFWIAKPQKWWLSCYSSLEYSPLSYDLEQKIGLGTLNIPLGIQLQLPIAKQNSLWSLIHLGVGTAFFYQGIYQKNAFNVLHQTLYAELGIHLAAVSLVKKQKKDLSLYLRYGLGWQGETSLNIGLRLHFWHWFNQR
jgi:hypothetical protein